MTPACRETDQMTIHYLIAGLGQKPNGGQRIIYEQANRLAARGHRVELHHFERFSSDRFRRIPRHILNYFVSRKASDPDWIDLSPSIKKTYSFFARMPRTALGDKVIATYWKTHTLLDYNFAPEIEYYYLIQGFESWIADEELLYRQWLSPSKNLVISKSLKNKVESIGADATLVPNAIDFDFFENRNSSRTTSRSVLFCSMASANKGSRDIVAAIGQLQRSGHNITARSFGDTHPNTWGAIDCEHHHLPDQTKIRELYNSAAVFVSASYSEGWGLTLAEATLCGCALLVSDASGHFEFVQPGRGALFFRRGNHPAIGRKIMFLLERPELRERLIATATHNLSSYTWDKSIDSLEEALGISLEKTSAQSA